MRMLLRDFRTGLYVGIGQEWTPYPETARTFANRFQAKMYQVRHGMPHAIVLAAGEVRRWRPHFPAEPGLARNPDPKWTTLEAKIELGVGNHLFIRGEGGGLDWHRSEPLTQIDADTWIWSTDCATQSLVFQLLLNDLIWAKGENLTAEPGTTLEVAPDFEWPEIPRLACLQ